jgi:lipopolysaccharide/colanic/teichoic acid biosynthesis glycosyltransferase
MLKGEISLIGPRPERPEFVEHRQARTCYRCRHAIKPGITGWAQVNHGYGNSFDDALIKLEYDLYYIKYRSFYLDLLILARTFKTVLKLSGT